MYPWYCIFFIASSPTLSSSNNFFVPAPRPSRDQREIADFDLRRLMVSEKGRGPAHVLVQMCKMDYFMSATEMYATDIPLWHPLSTGSVTWGAGGRSRPVEDSASFSDYALRPGVGMYRDGQDLAKQIVHADLPHIQRFVAAWNGRFRDVLGEVWAKHFRRMFPGVERGEYMTPQSSTGDIGAAWHATTGRRWTPSSLPQAIPSWFTGAADSSPGDCLPPEPIAQRSPHHWKRGIGVL